MSENKIEDSEAIDELMMADEETTEEVEAEEVETEETTEEPTEESTDETVETEEVETKLEVDPKDAVIGDFRRKNRDLELENARMQGELEARKSMNVTEPEVIKSPIDQAAQKWVDEGGNLDDFNISYNLLKEEEAFKAEQATKAQPEQTQGIDDATAIALDTLQNGDFSADKMGEGRDLMTVLTAANELYTEGEVLDMANFTRKNGKAAGLRNAYRVGVSKLEQAGKLTKPTKTVAKTVKTQKTETKSQSEKNDDLMTQEDKDYTTDSGSGDSDRLASFITGRAS